MSTFKTPVTLQAVRPMVIGDGQNAPVLQIPFEVVCDIVTKVHYLAYSMEVLKCLKFRPINSKP